MTINKKIMTMLILVMAVGAISMTYAATTFFGEDCSIYEPERLTQKACSDLNNLNDRVIALELIHNPIEEPIPEITITLTYEYIDDFRVLNITATGVSGTVNIIIRYVNIDGPIFATLSFVASSEGEIQVPWIIPGEKFGTFIVTVSDEFGSSSESISLPEQ